MALRGNRRPWALVALAVVSTLGGLFAGGPTSQAAPTVPLLPIPAVGMNVHALWSDAPVLGVVESSLADAHVGWLRIDVGWQSLQDTSRSAWSAYHLAELDAVVNGARAHGQHLLLTVWGTPRWANGGMAKIVPPTAASDYANAMGVLANRYRGRVEAWEIWNEPNHPNYFAGHDPVAYAALVKAAYPAVKAADPSALVVAGSTSYNDVGWLGQAYAAGMGGHFDVLSTHAYQGLADAPPEAPAAGSIYRFTNLSAVHDLMAAHGDAAKNIWVTEFGWSAHANQGSEANWERGVTPQQQADYLVRAIELARVAYPYVDHLFWYNARDRSDTDLHSNSYGVMRSDLSPKPALIALKAYLDPNGVATVSASDANALEGSSTPGVLHFTIGLDRPAIAPVSVHWSTVAGTATSGDFVGASGVVAIPAGARDAAVDIATVADSVVEPTETFGLRLGASTVAVGRAEATGTIVDDDSGLPTLDVLDARRVEGNAGSRSVAITVRLSAASTTPVSVTYAPKPRTATNADFWTSAPKVLTFSPGETSKKLYVGIRSDTIREGQEWFALVLSKPSGAILGRALGAITVVDDD